ncbi:MAG: polysaccharide deacetylase family protein, partial [Gemmatimonadetes bacterium]|nr:polysaccharide deacetylase family protein [Gemmatimonadota bacterium]
MRLVGLSIDVDSVASHLEGYGFERPADDGAAYRAAVPRIMNLLDSFSARATFFLIADEARHHPDVVRRIVARGHEVASHSMTHRLPFAQLAPPDLRLEVRGSKTLLEG